VDNNELEIVEAKLRVNLIKLTDVGQTQQLTRLNTLGWP
jgi:hypothetical protein